jgi:dCTP deaminase
MAFWSTEKIRARQKTNPLVSPYDDDRVQQGAYELKMGAQGAISCDGPNQITKLQQRDSFCVPRGQFALLMTEEKVRVPSDALGFISLKTSVKSRGLVNVSGFHVDPGYECRLKFWVYNAGNDDIHVLRGDPLFLIWFADLDQKTDDVYKKNREALNEITGDDLRQLHGSLSSPAALAKQIEQLEVKVRLFEWIGGTALVVLIGLCIALATPLLEYVIKPVVERFSKANSSNQVIAPLVTPGSISSIPATPASAVAPTPTIAGPANGSVSKP